MSTEPKAQAAPEGAPRRVHEGLRALYDAHAGAALGFATALVRERAAAEDVVHEAFVRLHAVLEGGAPEHPRAYLLTTVRNLALKELRRRDRQAKAHQALEVLSAGPADADPRRRQVQAALERLAPDLRAVLLLRHVHGLPYAELTQRLALSERTIRNRLRSAAVAFARQLRQLDAQEDL